MCQSDSATRWKWRSTDSCFSNVETLENQHAQQLHQPQAQVRDIGNQRERHKEDEQKQIVFKGEPFTAQALQRLCDRMLQIPDTLH